MNFDYSFLVLKPPSWPSPRIGGRYKKPFCTGESIKKRFPPWGEIERGVITKETVT